MVAAPARLQTPLPGAGARALTLRAPLARADVRQPVQHAVPLGQVRQGALVGRCSRQLHLLLSLGDQVRRAGLEVTVLVQEGRLASRSPRARPSSTCRTARPCDVPTQVACCKSLAAPLESSPNTRRSAARPPIITASRSSSSGCEIRYRSSAGSCWVTPNAATPRGTIDTRCTGSACGAGERHERVAKLVIGDPAAFLGADHARAPLESHRHTVDGLVELGHPDGRLVTASCQ